MREISLYAAGPLFTSSERMHNSFLEIHLKSVAQNSDISLRYTSPQRTALKRFISPEKGFNVAGIVSDCVRDSASHDVVLCNLDGPDSDSGTSVEYGVALGQRVARNLLIEKGYSGLIHVPKIITFRTDFRTAPEKEVGVNAMLREEGTRHIYHPCFVTEFEDFSEFYRELAKEIIDVIKEEIN